MTSEQQTQIHEYLLSKNLPIDFLPEIEDHFYSQVSKFMENESASFTTAFQQTKLLWAPELKMVRKAWFSFHKVPVMIKNIGKQCIRQVLKQSLLTTAVSMLLVMISAWLLSTEKFVMVTALGWVLMTAGTALIFITFAITSMKRKRTLASQLFSKLVVHLFFIYVMLSFLGLMQTLPMNSFKLLHEFANKSSAFSVDVYLLNLTQTFFHLFVFVTMIILLIQHEKAVKHIKKHLVRA